MQQSIVFVTLIGALFLFMTGRVRYDLVALMALFILALTGIIPSQEAFTGFAHPAVITVAAVMVISRGLHNSGLIDLLARWMQRLGDRISIQIFALGILTAFASAFMNNVGALAIMMPIAIKLARKSGHSPSQILMPLAFTSLLGGMMTLIGTPPNIIIATFRADAGGTAFKMFDFMPVGFPLTIIGILFVSFVGWRMLPKRKQQKAQSEIFEIDDYITEVLLTEDTKIIGGSIRDLMRDKVYDITIIGLIRNRLRTHIPDPDEILDINDILILEADSENLKTFVDKTKVKLLGDKELHEHTPGDKEIVLREVVVTQDSLLAGRSACQVNMRSRYGINLLAIARGDRKITRRISESKFRVGDVLLLQGRTQ
ncbi:MAG: SLC13 family permease, partial [Candidatus Cloacimonadaceae bacterium]|nr:SLC13 family permease [Candidatus Cloacimonadaceae bacterium]